MKCLKKVITFRRNLINEIFKPGDNMYHDYFRCSVRSHVEIKIFLVLAPLQNEIKNELTRKIMYEFV